MREAGFTLAEMLVVLVILSLLAVFAAGGIRFTSAPALSVEAERVVGALRLARAEAMARGRAVELRFGPDAVMAIPALGWHARLDALAVAEGPAAGTFGRPMPVEAVVFGPDGRAGLPGLGLAQGSERVSIELDALTGRIHAGG